MCLVGTFNPYRGHGHSKAISSQVGITHPHIYIYKEYLILIVYIFKLVILTHLFSSFLGFLQVEIFVLHCIMGYWTKFHRMFIYFGCVISIFYLFLIKLLFNSLSQSVSSIYPLPVWILVLYNSNLTMKKFKSLYWIKVSAVWIFLLNLKSVSCLLLYYRVKY